MRPFLLIHLRSQSRSIAVASAAVFAISCAFPITAGLSKNTASFPKWWGLLDVTLAFVLAFLVLAIAALAPPTPEPQVVESTYRAYRILFNGILVLIVVFFLFGNQISWINCLTGIAWRVWLLLYILPAWFTAMQGRK